MQTGIRKELVEEVLRCSISYLASPFRRSPATAEPNSWPQWISVRQLVPQLSFRERQGSIYLSLAKTKLAL